MSENGAQISINLKATQRTHTKLKITSQLLAISFTNWNHVFYYKFSLLAPLLSTIPFLYVLLSAHFKYKASSFLISS